MFDPAEVQLALDILPDDTTLQIAADRLQGLAHPSRIKALMSLSAAELCVGDIAVLVGLSLSATSTMLKQLRALGFIATRSAGKQTYYRLVSKDVPRILEISLSDVPGA